MQTLSRDNGKLATATTALAGLIMFDAGTAELISSIAYAVFVIAYAWSKWKQRK